MMKFYYRILILFIAIFFLQQLSVRSSQVQAIVPGKFIPIKPPVTQSPTVKSFSPVSGKTGTIVTVHGKYFTGTTSVVFGNVGASSFTVISDTLLNAVVGAGGSGSVIVSNIDGAGSLTYFTYIPAYPRPLITSVSPDTGFAGTVVTIRGANFMTSVTSVTFGSADAASFTILSDSVLTAIVGPGSSSGNVLVNGPGGIGGIGGFTFAGPAVTPPPSTNPKITSFSPDSAATGTIVTIHGQGFSGIGRVIFGAIDAASYTIVSDSLITAVVGPGRSGAVGVEGQTGSDYLGGFTYINPAANPIPVVTSFSPDSAAMNATVTIHGLYFTGADTVAFGGTGCFSFKVISDSLMTAVVGYGGTGSVYVETLSGAASLPGFTFINAVPAVMKQIDLYPNPAVGSTQTVTVPGNATGSSKFELTDINGKVLRVIPVSPQVSHVQINTTGLPKGVYKLVWSDGRNNAYQTVLVL